MSPSLTRLGALLAIVCGLAASKLAAQQTAQLAGVVVTTDSSRTPVRRAIVTITATDQQSGGAVTDDQGRFVIAGLSPGRFTLTVSKPGYLPTTYSATPERRSRTFIELAAGAAVTNLVVPIVRGAAMSGVVRDANGDPASGVRVMALPRGTTVRTADAPERSTFTDDRGAYRLYGLPVGEYALAVIPQSVGALPIDVMTEALVDAALHEQERRTGRAAPAIATPPPAHPSRGRSYVPIFYPSTASGADATWLTLAAGDDRTGLDVTLSLVPVALVEGRILGVDGAPISAAQPTLTNTGPFIPPSITGSVSPELTMTPGANGVFRINRVAPGRYTLSVRMSPTGPTGAPVGTMPGWASMEVDVAGDDIRGLELRLQPMLSFSGRVTFPGAPPAPGTLTQIRVTLSPLSVGSTREPAAIAVSDTVQPDGTFDLSGLIPGPYRMSISAPVRTAPVPLWLRAATLAGRDLLDAPIDMKALGNVTDVVATLSDRHTELSGVLRTADGQADPDDVVVVFPVDRALWQPASRRIRAVRTASDGRYVLADLPPGEYLLATLPDGASDELQMPDVLEQMAPTGFKFTLGEGERKTQDLRAR